MLGMNKKIVNKGGFTLTEVMIGIMILTIAIISASNLLVGLVRTNKLNTQTLQAYYFAQEGIELVRNIRDTNWLLNVGFSDEGIGKGDFILDKGETYAINLNEGGWANSKDFSVIDEGGLNVYKPWDIRAGNLNDKYNDVFKLDFISGSEEENVVSPFYRRIEISGDEKDFVLVRSIVSWKDGKNDREVSLETILSNWKGGAL